MDPANVTSSPYVLIVLKIITPPYVQILALQAVQIVVKNIFLQTKTVRSDWNILVFLIKTTKIIPGQRKITTQTILI
jgi:hypothetical protein